MREMAKKTPVKFSNVDYGYNSNGYTDALYRIDFDVELKGKKGAVFVQLDDANSFSISLTNISDGKNYEQEGFNTAIGRLKLIKEFKNILYRVY